MLENFMIMKPDDIDRCQKIVDRLYAKTIFERYSLMIDACKGLYSMDVAFHNSIWDQPL